MRRVIDSSLCVQLLGHGCLGLRPCLAGLKAVGPRVPKAWVTNASAVSEPRTAMATTTSFPGLDHDATFRA